MPTPVEIEINVRHSEPTTVIVGLPDTAVKESKDRVHTAIINSGFKPHVGRMTICFRQEVLNKTEVHYARP